MKWLLLSSFVTQVRPGWLFHHAPLHEVDVQAVPATYHHDRSRDAAGLADWRDYFNHARAAVATLRGARTPMGIITTFPQLAVCACLLKRLTWRRRFPVIAWMFNLKRPYQGVKGAVARFALAAADRIVVHSRAEITAYSRWLRLPEDRFVYVPLTAEIPAVEPWRDDASQAPYVVALGTANRDYRTLFAALAQTGRPAVVVSGPSALEGLAVPPNVQVRSGLTLVQCHELVRRARVHVIPIADVDAPSGQVTLIEGMMIGCPVVVTRCAGSTDYLDDGAEGLMVAPADAASLAVALERLWDDASLRVRLGTAARERALSQYVFPGAARAMAALLAQWESGTGVPRAERAPV